MTVRGDAAAALVALSQREQMAPTDAALKLSLALALRAAGDPAAAERKAGEAVACAPGDARARHVLGFLLRERGALAEAAAHLLDARRIANDVADPFHLAALTRH
jgi:Flp pilus assembly protein TadD